MKLLFVTEAPFFPHFSGGAEQFILSLFGRLRKKGWKFEVLCRLPAAPVQKPVLDRHWQPDFLLRRPRQLILKDRGLGFPCWRIHPQSGPMKPLLEDRLRCFQPDVVLGHLWDAQTVPLLEHAAQRGFPSFFSVQRVEEILDGFRFPENIHVIAHSPFTASLAAVKTSQKVGLILHSIEQNRYRVKKRKRKYITFINPIPEKGLAIAAEAARRLPDERFLFVEGGWGNGLAECRQAVRGLSNVEIWSHQTDMRRVYGITDILLIPSQYDETFGRVILEAQMNGIPVVAAARGAIPHTLGKGGCLIRLPHQAAGYVAAIRRLRSSPAFYQKRSAWARANSRRLEFKPSVQAENFVRFVKQSMAESR